MLPLRHVRRWQVASLILLFFVLAAALMPAVWFWGDKVRALVWFSGVDKWLHGVTFFVLALWFTGMYRRRSYWRVALGLLAFGLVIEVCQRMVAHRTADAIDVVADAAGIGVGLAVGFAITGGWCLALENWFYRRRAESRD